MSFEQRRRTAALLLGVFVALSAAWLLRLDFHAKISTDVLDLIPAGEREPELALVRRLASDVEARTMLVRLTRADGSAVDAATAARFAADVKRSPAFADAIALDDPSWRDALGRELFALRLPLLFPGWLERHAGADAAARAAPELQRFLQSPAAMAYQDLVPADPLLLLPDVLARFNEPLALGGGSARGARVWAQLAVSPLGEAGQAPAFAAIDAAARATGVHAAFTGVNRFAAASRARIEREVSLLNTLSALAVLAVAFLFVRQVHRALHLLPVIALATLGAWVATTVVFERVHVIVFVLGALLTGVAIDYGFYLFMQPAAAPEEDYPRKVRRLAKPLVASCATTVAGFALLLFAELPMIRQLGVFVGAGLVTALLGAVLYFATVRDTFLAPRTWHARAAFRPATRGRARWTLVALWLLALGGLARLEWHDDIRDLEVPAPALLAEDAQIRAAFGQGGEHAVFLSHGANLDEARAALESFDRWLSARGATFANLAPVVPSAPARAATLRFLHEHPDFPAELRAALAANGFDPAAFGPFFDAYAGFTAHAGADTFAAAVARLQHALSGPLALLVHADAEKAWFVTLASGAPAPMPPAETHTLNASQLQTLNRLFARYRASAVRLSLIGLAIVGGGVLLTYGVRDGVRIFLIPCGACLGVFGAFGWAGQPLNLFHLLGAFLGVCLTHNYSIFSATSAFRREPPPVSVRLSALTTAASFGVLATSAIPVVRALGLTVATMVLAALAVIELEHLAPLARQPNP